MSDSEVESQSSVGIPTDERLEKGLRDTVAGIFRSGNTDELTVKRVRLATEQALDLEEGFFKSHDIWKAKSAEVIREEVVRVDISQCHFALYRNDVLMIWPPL